MALAFYLSNVEEGGCRSRLAGLYNKTPANKNKQRMLLNEDLARFTPEQCTVEGRVSPQEPEKLQLQFMKEIPPDIQGRPPLQTGLGSHFRGLKWKHNT